MMEARGDVYVRDFEKIWKILKNSDIYHKQREKKERKEGDVVRQNSHNKSEKRRRGDVASQFTFCDILHEDGVQI